MEEDTDVLLLSLANHDKIENIYIQCGNKNRLRHVDVSKLGHSLGKTMYEYMLGLHACTGCDSVSAFAGRENVSGVSLLLKEGTFQKATIQFRRTMLSLARAVRCASCVYMQIVLGAHNCNTGE